MISHELGALPANQILIVCSDSKTEREGIIYSNAFGFITGKKGWSESVTRSKYTKNIYRKR